MLALPQLKALLKVHNLYRCYINKDDAIPLLLEKGIIIIIIIIIIISTFINSARVTQCHNGAGWRQRLSSAHQICL